MSMGTNADGTVDVRVVLTVNIDAHAYVVNVMEVDDANQKELRDDVKRRVRDFVRYYSSPALAIKDVQAQGVY